MNTYKVVNKGTGQVLAVDQAETSLELVRKYKLAYESQKHLKLVQIG